MRIIFNKAAADSITNYISFTDVARFQGASYWSDWEELTKSGDEIFDGKFSRWDHIKQARTSLDSFSSFPLLKADQYLVHVYGNKASKLVGSCWNYVNRINGAKQKAMNLMVTLRKEYHLK